MAYNPAKIDDAVLALLAAFSFDNGRAWKGFDFEVMDRLHARGLIEDPRSKAKSTYLTAQGLDLGLRSAERMFGGTAAGAG